MCPLYGGTVLTNFLQSMFLLKKRVLGNLPLTRFFLGTKVEKVGYNIENFPYPGLVLESCYPLNALYITPNRYLVFAKFITSSTSQR
jgi:hypothetical protein